MVDLLLVIGFVISVWSMAYGISLMRRIRYSERVREIQKYVHITNNQIQREGLR